MNTSSRTEESKRTAAAAESYLRRAIEALVTELAGRSAWDEVLSDCTVLIHSFPDPLGGRVEIRRVVQCSQIW